MVFHSESNYDYHFIVKELRNKFEGEFNCLAENTEKYETLNSLYIEGKIVFIWIVCK